MVQFNHLKRREVIALLGATAASPFTARGQQPDRMRRIGLLMTASENDPGYQVLLTTFRDELKKLGWEERRDILIEYRWKAIDKKSRQQLAKELVALQPDLMLAQTTTATRGRAATSPALSIWKLR